MFNAISFNIKKLKLISTILRLFVGLLFIVSALAKLYPIEPFEIIFVDLGLTNWLLAPFFARAVIIVELFLGLCIVFNQWFRNYIYYFAQGLLILFTIYLVYLLITKGNTNDCGCFGSWLALSPLASIIKNLVICIALFLIKKDSYHRGLQWVFPLLFLLISIPSVFLLNRVGLQNSQAKAFNDIVNFTELPPLYSSSFKVNFNEGNKLVIFLSVDCSHCKSLAYKLAHLTKEGPVNVILIMRSKDKNNLVPFFEETGLELPFIWVSDVSFFKYSGGRLPAIIFIEKGILKKKWTGEFVNLEELEELMEY